MLKDDHKTVEQLFKRFEKAGDRAHVEKRDIVDRIIETLVDARGDRRAAVLPGGPGRPCADTEDIVLESLEEHHIVKWVLSELDSMSPEDERFDAKVTVLIENVRHHVQEEEQELFPMVRNELGRNSLQRPGRGHGGGQEGGADPPPPPLTGHAPRQPRGGTHGGRRRSHV